MQKTVYLKPDFHRMKKLPYLLALTLSLVSFSQSPLSIENIMKGERFTGYSPENIQWSADSKQLYFSWNSEMEDTRSAYVFQTGMKSGPVKATTGERKSMLPSSISWNPARSKAVYSRNGDIFLYDVKNRNTLQLTNSVAPESSPVFTSDESKIIFTTLNNIYSLEITSGRLVQLTDFRTGKGNNEPERTPGDSWLFNDQMKLFSVLIERKKRLEAAEKDVKDLEPPRPKIIYTGQDRISGMQLSPDQNFVIYLTQKPSDEKRTSVPDYVTESGYTGEISSRPKVGTTNISPVKLNIYNIDKDSVYQVVTAELPGINEQPEFLKSSDPSPRSLSYSMPVWSGDGRYAALELFSTDHKDRWIMLLDAASGKLKLVDRQHDEAWIGGPGSRRITGWLPDNRTLCFQSEESGFSHLYSADVITGEKKALTSGRFEVYEPQLSSGGKVWYFISNETDPGVRELYRMPAYGGPRTKITTFGGGVESWLSPDEKYFALRVSHPDKPWELYILENSRNATPEKITESTTADFRAYPWRVPEIIRFRGADGTMVPARLYRPANTAKNGPAVIFVHGAGYLQNVHMWWSSYFREYMFHNFLADNGYTILDIDYRGSSGYGRDWRTAIYRQMGGIDLQDHIDGAKYLAEQHGVDPGRIGIYGGSYGGFITLMGLFTSPGTFSAGAALRPVTDWAHYNHGYTSNILNTPATDSLSYVKSSPIYYAGGLSDHLLICHGMVDDNVHFQDVVRLVQRLIELGKENWELAVYPVESHGFTEPSSWVDEYKRIYKLFEENLKK
jgi:dipeptidyl aminopeptidase/acylaminoacyl peptidase